MLRSNCQLEIVVVKTGSPWKGVEEEATEIERYVSQSGLPHYNNQYHSWFQRKSYYDEGVKIL